jgi:hypothetical protein
MMSKIWNVKLLQILLSAVFLFGLLPISNHMPAMQTMHMDAKISLSSATQEKRGNSSTDTCCEAIGSLLLVCDFMIFQSACADPSGDSKEILHSIPIFQSLYIQFLGPPPKA